MELADVEEEGEDAAEVDGEDADSEEVEKEGGDLQKGMEGERMMKSGFLYKKQERRKVCPKQISNLTGRLADHWTRSGRRSGSSCVRTNWPTTRTRESILSNGCWISNRSTLSPLFK